MLLPLRHLLEFWQTHAKQHYLNNTHTAITSKGFKQNSPTSCDYSWVAKPQRNYVVYLKQMSIKAFHKTRLSSVLCKSHCSGKVCVNLCSQISSQENIQPAVGNSKMKVHTQPLQPQGLVQVLGMVLRQLGILQSTREGWQVGLAGARAETQQHQPHCLHMDNVLAPHCSNEGKGTAHWAAFSIHPPTKLCIFVDKI